MKINKPVIALAQVLVASGAFAMSVPLLAYHSSQGSVFHAEKHSCVIFADHLVKTGQKGGKDLDAESKKIAFTAEVKNTDAVVALIEASKKGKVKKAAAHPVGGAVESYDTIQMLPNDGTTETPLLVQNPGLNMPLLKNTSAAAKKLVEFINYNCNQQ